MTRLCYFHPVPLVTARGKTACPQCGTLYPTLPAVPTKPDAAQLPGGLGVTSSRFAPAGAFYST